MSRQALIRPVITFVSGTLLLLAHADALEALRSMIQQRPAVSNDTVRRAPTRIQDMILAPQVPTMPNVVDSTQSAAQSALVRAKIRLDTVIFMEVAGIRPGIVLRQSPQAGAPVSARLRTMIAVSSAPAPPPMPNVPNLIGMTEAEAVAALANTRLRLGQVERVESPEPAGRIFFQYPQPGQAPLSTRTFAVAVRIAVPETVIMPDLTGLTSVQAEQTLAKFRLKAAGIQRERVAEGAVSDGTVFRQSPEAGLRVPLSARVLITLAFVPPPPAPPVVIVTPPVTPAPLTPPIVSPAAPPVSTPLPPPVTPASPVRVTPPRVPDVVLPAPQIQLPAAQPQRPVLVRVPDVRGFTREEARARLAGVRLALGTMQLDTVAPGPATIAGVVTAQNPLQGAFALQDTPVNVRLTFVQAAPVRDGVPAGLLGVTGVLAALALAALVRAMRREHRRRSERIAGLLVSAQPSANAESAHAVLRRDPATTLSLRITPGYTLAAGTLKNGNELRVTEGDSRG